ncbi:MAG: DUF308 domain-containing protein [Anaerolineales bacterium]|nr:DUF308 domain-containing protein [Anaerolineales bacterium]
MENGRSTIFVSTRSLPWWSLLVPGVIAILAGAFIFFQTDNFVQLLTITVGFFVLLNGIATVIGAIRSGGDSGRRLLTLLRGVLGIVIGALALTLPFMFAAIAWSVMLTLVAIQLIIAAILEIGVAYRLRGRGAPMSSALVSAVFSILLAVLLLSAPAAVGVATLRFIAIFIILLGIALVVMGWRLRR